MRLYAINFNLRIIFIISLFISIFKYVNKNFSFKLNKQKYETK